MSAANQHVNEYLYTCHNNREGHTKHFHRINNRFRIDVTKVKSRTFECHPIIINTVQMNMLSIGTLTEKYV